MNKNFDIIVIGGGPGGYIASIYGSQNGFKVACIDNWMDKNGNPTLGGTCTNVGCIPSKTLLQSSLYYKQSLNSFKKYGINIKNIKLNIKNMMKHKNNIIKKNNQGILYLFKKNNVHFFNGIASFKKKKNKRYFIKIKKSNKIIINAKYIIIATGSKPKKFNNIPFDENLILSNSGGLSINKKIKNLCIVGSGVVGLEIGTIWRRLGVKVTILEKMPFFLNSVDSEIANKAYSIFLKQGLNINLNSKIKKIKKYKNKKILIQYYDKNLKYYKKKFDKIIISIGRSGNIKKLNCNKIGLKINKNNFIKINNKHKTNLKNIWAIGDVAGEPLLAHKAEEEGIFVVRQIKKINITKKNKNIPSVIYTHPEIAWVGKTEEEVKKKNIPYKKGIFPLLANAKARILEEKSGLIKLITELKTNKIIGIHIISPSASEIISQATIAINFSISAKNIANICFPHPSLSESLKEAAFSINEKLINV